MKIGLFIMDNACRRRAWEKGLFAEALAGLFLRIKGYRILAKRYKSSLGEIDLIIQKSSVIAFVEVKYRRSWDAALEAVQSKQQARIKRSAQIFLSKKPEKNYQARFDVFLVKPFAFPVHMKNAF